jgi:hypothetical protein
MNPSLVSVDYAFEAQRRAMLLQAIADWAASTGAEHVRDRRYAMTQIAVAKARRALKRAEVAAAIRRAAANRQRRAA